ncbi:MAG: hypothetical protein COA38_17230, partial [Fluviicola sp.]
LKFKDSKKYKDRHAAAVKSTGETDAMCEPGDADALAAQMLAVLDDKNKVVGHVLAGGDFGNGILKVYAAPISLTKKILGK